MVERLLLEADHLGMTFWLAIDSATRSAQLRRMMSDCVLENIQATDGKALAAPLEAIR